MNKDNIERCRRAFKELTERLVNNNMVLNSSNVDDCVILQAYGNMRAFSLNTTTRPELAECVKDLDTLGICEYTDEQINNCFVWESYEEPSLDAHDIRTKARRQL